MFKGQTNLKLAPLISIQTDYASWYYSWDNESNYACLWID